LIRLHAPIRGKRSGSVKGAKGGQEGQALLAWGFKEEAIWLVHSCYEKYPVARTTRDLDVSTEALRKWVNQAQIAAGEHDGLTTEAKEGLPRLRKEVEVLKEEREIVRCALVSEVVAE
jgi:Transposase